MVAPPVDQAGIFAGPQASSVEHPAGGGLFGDYIPIIMKYGLLRMDHWISENTMVLNIAKVGIGDSFKDDLMILMLRVRF